MTETSAERQARNRKAWRSQPIPAHLHGKASTYRERGCRCFQCTSAVTQDVAKYRNRAKQKTGESQ